MSASSEKKTAYSFVLGFVAFVVIFIIVLSPVATVHGRQRDIKTLYTYVRIFTGRRLANFNYNDFKSL